MNQMTPTRDRTTPAADGAKAGVRNEIEALLADLAELRDAITETGRLCDRQGIDPAENMALISRAGVNRLLVPLRYRGLRPDDDKLGAFEAFIRASIEVSAGDGPTGQNFGSTSLIAGEIFFSSLPESTKQEVARRLLHENLRLVSSAAPTGQAGPVTARKVEGGVVVSGTKSFNTNSGGRGLANVVCLMEGVPGPYFAIVDLSAPGVELHNDWDNMGQRGTVSQTVTYNDVFVADGWHHAPAPITVLQLAMGMAMHGSLMQGIGEGALAATVAHARTMKRGSMPQFASPATDPMMLRRIGKVSSHLAASRALLLNLAHALEVYEDGDLSPLIADAFRAKVACVDASLAAAEEIFEITGARSTSNKFGLDRYWRNARTFACHDPTDTKNVFVGMYEMTGELPSMQALHGV
jgi:alkylation response protein AidB-like acyl-CoA dehydrogenase